MGAAMIRLGAIGAGMVFHRYAQAAAALPEVIITAVADPNPKQRAAAIAPGRHVLSDIHALLEEPIDAVLVLTPNSEHSSIVEECLRYGKSTLCEKPVAIGAQRVREIFTLARCNGAFLYPAMHCRHRPEIRYIREHCSVAVVEFGQVWREDWRGAPAWYRDPARAGGGVLLDVGTNQIDWISPFVGPLEVATVEGEAVKGGLEEECLVHWQFPGGTGSLELSWRGAPQHRRSWLSTEDGRAFELDHDRRIAVHNGRIHGPWNNDEYEGVLREFLLQCADPSARDPAACERIASILELIRRVYARLGLPFLDD